MALFASQREAQRHADAAAYVFEVFALPVYEDCSELPRWLRHPWRSQARWRERITDEVTLTADALTAGEIEVVEAGTVAAVVDFDPPEPQEVRLLFTHVSVAAPYLREAADWNVTLRAETTPVYGSYDDCPPEQRFTAPGLMPFQGVHPR
ncbi:hypothetical protein OM076_09305 [Solirubrobacter ginsenosidimutans]|uniref:Uncharacterized protein n=1 Tax=Solirubrobacter ginsenosidimutans TaxID=490573 RepID=A0A9X3MRG9_9ACTN|nr:hypothetical protein [Solirubrobacter ginsenosidimutans]MDA0160462.1 hypothetical protein [Solirubrobacter ginsenosidimutans]